MTFPDEYLWAIEEGGDALQGYVQSQVSESDVWFTDSPDAGENCPCSRCGKTIEEKDTPLRVFDDGRERRYHPECLGIRVEQDEFTEEGGCHDSLAQS